MLDLNQRRRRAFYRAWRRGTREMDLLLGRFASASAEMDQDRLAAFEALLDQSDPDIYGWVVGKEPYQGRDQELEKLIDAIRAFHAD